METGIIFDRNTGHVKDKNPAVTVSRAGVVNISTIYNRDIAVNSESMVDMLDEAICKSAIKPQCDMNGLFAGKVTITVEFLGDMEEKNVLEDGSGA